MDRFARHPVLVSVVPIAGIAVLVTIGVFLINDNSGRVHGSPPTTKAPCELEELPLPEGAEGPVKAAAISDSGEYIAGTANDKLIRWRDNEPEVLSSGGGKISGVNSSGVVVGVNDEPWVYRDNAMTRLKPASDNDGKSLDNNPPAINDDGIIVAPVTVEYADDGGIGSAQLWEPGKDKAKPFPFPDDESGGVWAINANGVAVGRSGDGLGGERPWAWDLRGETGHELLAPEELETASATHADNGWAAMERGLLWDLDAPSTPPQALNLSTVTDVDAQGTVYGESDARPVLQRQDGEQQLLPLPEEDSANTKVLGASSDGATVVGYSGIGVTSRALVWGCD